MHLLEAYCTGDSGLQCTIHVAWLCCLCVGVPFLLSTDDNMHSEKIKSSAETIWNIVIHHINSLDSKCKKLIPIMIHFDFMFVLVPWKKAICYSPMNMIFLLKQYLKLHYNDVIMSAMTSRITSLHIVYSSVHSGADQRKHQSPASLVLVRGIHRWPVNSQHKRPVTRKKFPFDDVIMST